MKLWLLVARNDLPDKWQENPWEPWYDKSFGFVIRAETEERARSIPGGVEHFDDAWINPKYSTCIELLPEGYEGIVLEDFHAA